MYVLPNKPWKSNSVLKFLHLFSESIFSISNIEVTNNIVRMKKLIDEIEEKKINARFVDFSMTMFLPVLAIVKYNVMLPEHLSESKVLSDDYVNKWRYLIILDVNAKSSEDDKRTFRETIVHTIAFRRSNLKLEQLKKKVTEEILEAVNESSKKIQFNSDEEKELFRKYVERVPSYLFPAKNKSEQENSDQ